MEGELKKRRGEKGEGMSRIHVHKAVNKVCYAILPHAVTEILSRI